MNEDNNLEKPETNSLANKAATLPKFKIVAMNDRDLKNFSSDRNNDNKLQFQNTMFIKGPSFSKHLRKSALKFCRECLISQLNCLFVESDSYFTVWLQQSPSYIS